jgi:hypothetical protein
MEYIDDAYCLRLLFRTNLHQSQQEWIFDNVNHPQKKINLQAPFFFSIPLRSIEKHQNNFQEALLIYFA